jgi:hypothetical protein
LTLKEDPVSYFRHQIANAFGFPLFYEFTLIIMFAVSARISEGVSWVHAHVPAVRQLVTVIIIRPHLLPVPFFNLARRAIYPLIATGDFTQVSEARSPSETDPLLDGETTPQVY